MTVANIVSKRRVLPARAAVVGLVIPVAARAHGEQLMVFPLSGLLSILVMIPIVLTVRAKLSVKLLTVFLALPLMQIMTWWIVDAVLDPSPASLYHYFFVYALLMAAIPVLACLSILLSRRLRRPD